MMTSHTLESQRRIAQHLLWPCLFLLLATWSAWAAPFRDLPITFTQPDGTKVELRGWGDEFYAVFETLEGYTVVFDKGLRAYCFAQGGAGGVLVSSGVQVQQGDPATLGLAKHLRMSEAARSAQVQQRYSVWEDAMQIRQRWSSLKAAARAYESQSGSGDTTSQDRQPSPPPTTTTGTKVGLTLLIDFDDDPATVPQSDLDGLCNGDNYTAHGNNGSVKKYYYDNSNGLLTYSNVVTVYIRIPNSLHPKSWYNDPTKDAGQQANYLIRDAITIMKALPNYTTDILPTFNNLTVNGNNEVIAFNVLYAGDNGGVWSMGLWPHSWSLQVVGAQSLSTGGKKVNRYEVTNIGTTPVIGTFCHENGHMLCGYPDLYDYTYSSGGVGDWCLMDSGNYGGTPSGANPTQICAYLKRAAGWATTTELTNGTFLTATVTATNGANFNHFYRYQKPGVSTEYYLAECRFKVGRDADLPGSGTLIWHIDELGDNSTVNLSPNTSHNNYEATLVQADHLWDMEHNRNSGDSKDPYYSANTASGYSNQLTDSSNPNAHWWAGTASGLKFSGFSARAAEMTFVVGDPPPVANFTASPLSGAAPLANVAFSDLSTGAITNRSWDFGDGSTLPSTTATNVQHTYVYAGLYSPTLTVKGPGGTGSTNRLNYIVVTNVPPVASFVASPTSGLVPLKVHFTNTSSGSYTNAQWTFGDGTSSNTMAAVVSKTYGTLGIYTATLVAAGPVGTSTSSIPGYIVVTNGPPVPDFSAFPTNGRPPLMVTFQNTSLGLVTNAVWDFGDGTIRSSTAEFVTNTYLLAGNYTVGLTVSSSGGMTATNRLSSVIVTNPLPEPAFAAWPTNGSAVFTAFYFTNLTQFATNYSWSFGDGTATNLSTAATVAHIYAKAGNYTVCLTATGLGGTSSTCSSSSLVVTNPPSNILAWGDNSEGQCSVAARATDALAIGAGAWHNLALRTNGYVLTWGSDYSGQCDAPPTSTDALAIAAGGFHSLAITPGGTVVAWGANDSGQTDVPAGLNRVLGVAAGMWHSVALRSDGRLSVWGDNSLGQTNQPSGLTNVVGIAAGGNHTLALRADGTVVAWGENTDAYGNISGQSDVPWGLSNVVAIAAGDYHSLAVTADGRVVPWGDDSEGQCDVPSNLTNVVAVAAGGAHSVALKADGTLVAWGANWNGQCAIPASATNVVTVAAGEAHTLALLDQSLPAPRLLSPTRKAGRTTFLLQTVQRRTYALECKNSLAETNWVTLSTVNGNGSLRMFTDSSPGVAQRFYRVRQW
jgi:M6 family metalloprotease-like protein